MKRFLARTNSPKCKSLWRKLSSLAVIMAMLMSMLVMPNVSAADVTEGYTTKNTTVYSVFDAYDATNDSITVNSDDSLWKIAVSTGKDSYFFSGTNSDFGVSAEKSDDGLVISWTAPEGATGDAVIRMNDGAKWEKVEAVTGSSYTLTDYPVGVIQIQVIIGNAVSEVYSYGNTILDADVHTVVTEDIPDGKDKSDVINPNSTYSNLQVDLGDAKQYVSKNGGLMLKVETSMTEGADHDRYSGLYGNFYDSTGTTKVNAVNASGAAVGYGWGIKYDTETGEIVSDRLSSHDLWYGYSVTLAKHDISEADPTLIGAVYKDLANHTANGANLAYAIDTENGVYNSFAAAAGGYGITHTALANATYKDATSKGFTNGYIYLPFDHYTNEIIDAIAKDGMAAIIAEQGYYYGFDLANATANKAAKNICWLVPKTDENGNYVFWTDADGNYVYNNEGYALIQYQEVRTLNDRKINVTEAKYIVDYAQYANSNIDIAGAAHTTVAPTSSIVLPEGEALLTAGKNLSSPMCNTTGAYVSLLEGYTFNIAAGEWAKIGFTAPEDGYYEFSNALNAEEAAAASYRVVAEDLTGNRTLIRAEEALSGDGEFVILTKLDKGETVWVEASADVDGAEVNLGAPRAIKINNFDEETGSYSSVATDYHLSNDNDSLGRKELRYYTGELRNEPTAWRSAYFMNPIAITDNTGTESVTTVYKESDIFAGKGLTTAIHTNKVKKADGTTIIVDYDTLGVANLRKDSSAKAILDNLGYYNATRVDTRAGKGGGAMFPLSCVWVSSTNYQSDGFNFQYGGFLGLSDGAVYANVTSANAKGYVFGFGYPMAGTADRGTVSKKQYVNIGVVFEYTAPADGVITDLDFKRITGNGVINLILKNDVVLEAYHSDTATALPESIDVKAGDKIRICFARADGGYTASNAASCHTPSLTFTPDVAKITVEGDSSLSGLVGGLLGVGTEIELPAGVTKGGYFMSWTDKNENEYVEGDTYTVEEDDTLSPSFMWYGDVDYDDEITTQDMVSIKKHILGAEILEDDAYILANVSGDENGDIDVIDLIRIKKYFAKAVDYLGPTV